MNNNRWISLCQLRKAGIPIVGLPKDPPRRKGCALVALITNGKPMKFAVVVDDPMSYGAYRSMTHHRGDMGNWIFGTMKLFFVPNVLAVQSSPVQGKTLRAVFIRR